MSSIRDIAQVDLIINGKEAVAELDRTRKKVGELNAALDAARKRGDKIEARKLNKDLREAEQKLELIGTAADKTAMVMNRLVGIGDVNGLRKYRRELVAGLKYIQRGSEAWDEQQKKIRAVSTEIEKINKEGKLSMSLWSKITDFANRAWVVASAFILGVTQLKRFIYGMADAFAKMDQEMANVRKYTGMTKDEVEDLNEEFKKMDTRTSREGLNQLAGEAGKLGKQSKEDVLGFVRAADKINVALDELGEGATLTLSKLTGIFGDEERLGTEKSLLSIGSAVNELAQNSRAGAPYLVEFASRMGGVASQAGMTSAQVLGFGAVLDSYGQKVESSSTALSQVMVRIYREPAKYARVAGLDIEKFTELVKTDMNNAVITLLEALNKAGGMDVLSPMFKDMGENGSRAIQALSTLATNIDEVKQRQQEATVAFDEATSVTKEFNVQNNTVQARLEKARKRVQELKVELGEKLMPVMGGILSGTKNLIVAVSWLFDFIGANYGKILVTAGAWAAWRIVVNAQNIAFRVHYGLLVLVEKGQKALNATMATGKAVMQLLTAGFFALTGQTRKADVCMKAFNATLKANPIGLVITLVISLVTWLTTLIGKEDEAAKKEAQREKTLSKIAEIEEKANKEIGERTAKIRMLTKVVEDSNRSLEDRRGAIDALKKIVPGYNAQIDEEGRLIRNNTKALEDYIDALKREAIIKGAQEEIAKIGKEIYQAERSRYDTENRLTEWRRNLQDFQKRNQNYMSAKGELSLMRHGGNGDVSYTQFTGDTKKILNRYGFTDLKSWEKVRSTERYLENGIQLLSNGVLNVEKRIRNAEKTIDEINDFMNTEGVELSEMIGVLDEGGNSPGNLGGNSEGNSGGNSGGSADKAGKERFEAEKKWRTLEEALVTNEYLRGERSFEDYTRRMRDISEQYYSELLGNAELSAEERAEIEREYLEKVQNLDEKERKAQIEKEKREYEELQMMLLQRYLQNESDKDSYDKAIELAEVQHLQRMVMLCESGSEEYNAALKAYLEKEKKMRDGFAKEAEEAEKKLQEKRKEFKETYFGNSAAEDKKEYEAAMGVLNAVYENELKNAGDNAEEKERIENKFQAAKIALAKKYNQEEGEDIRSGYRKTIEGIAEWLNGDGGKMLMASLDVLVSGMSGIFGGLTDIVQAELEIQSAAIEKRYEKEISAAEGNNYKVKQLEKQKERELAKAKKEANRKAFVMQVMQAVATTAQGAINAYASAAQAPFPLGITLPPIAAAMALAAGAIQIAAIKKQQQASEASGYAKGGFTPAGRVDEPVGVVHAGEWVASQKLLASPGARAIINTLDYAQKTNTIGRLDADDVSRSITAPSVIAQSTTSGQVAQSMEAQALAFAAYAETMRRLQERLEEPFVTVNTVTGDAGIKKAQDDYDKLMKNKSPKR